MSTADTSGNLSPDAAPGTAVGGWRVLSNVLARTTPQAVHASALYRANTLRLIARRRRVRL